MAKWGNALGGWKRQTRDARGRFGSGKGGPSKKLKHPYGKKSAPKSKKSSRKEPKKQVTRSRKNGITYETTRKSGLLGSTTHTKAYRGREFVGYADGGVNRKRTKASFENIYVEPKYRGSGVSGGLISRQSRALKSYGAPVSVTGDRSDGGQKLVERTRLQGARIENRSSGMSSSEITEIMGVFGAGERKAHQKSWDKAKKAKNSTSRKKWSKKKKATVT